MLSGHSVTATTGRVAQPVVKEASLIMLKGDYYNLFTNLYQDNLISPSFTEAEEEEEEEKAQIRSDQQARMARTDNNSVTNKQTWGGRRYRYYYYMVSIWI